MVASLKRFYTLAASTACCFGIMGMQQVASAGSLSPRTYEATIGLGETLVINKTVTVDDPPISKLDVFFLADNTGSMASIINTVSTNATSLLSELSGTYSDIGFGVGRYLGDPTEGVAATTAYQILQPITLDTSSATSAIDNWFASGGGDWPEANLFSLHQVATSGGSTDTGYSTGYNTGWRDGAEKMIVWFGDAPSHTSTVDLDEAIAALTENNITVAAINTQGAGSGIDTDGQASQIVAATGGVLTSNTSSAEVVDVVQDTLRDLTSSIDLEFATFGDTSGLDISFACTDALGCTGVGGGESRTFDLIIKGVAEGFYDFDTVVVGVDGAVEDDFITVAVPENSSVFGLLAVAGVGATLVRGRKQKEKAASELS